MSEPSLERLSRFTPDAGRLDRDALLFDAGRRSARSGRGWKSLATLLAGTQALTLAFLLRPPVPAGGRLVKPIAHVSAPAPAPVARAEMPGASPDLSLWSARRRRFTTDVEVGPTPGVSLIESRPPLRAFPRPLLLVD